MKCVIMLLKSFTKNVHIMIMENGGNKKWYAVVLKEKSTPFVGFTKQKIIKRENNGQKRND